MLQVPFGTGFLTRIMIIIGLARHSPGKLTLTTAQEFR